MLGLGKSKGVGQSCSWLKPPAKDDGWMTCAFMSYSTVFLSYQDDGRVIMKGCVQQNLLNGWRDFHLKLGSTLDH